MLSRNWLIGFVKQRKIKAKQLPLQRDTSDVPMSTEMLDWLSSSLEPDEDGNLPGDGVFRISSSMDAMGLYTPVGAIAASQYAGLKPEESLNEKESRRRKEQASASKRELDDLSMSGNLFS